MVILYIIFFLALFRKELCKKSSEARYKIVLLLVECTVGMVLYELYVEFACQMRYSVPMNDDTRWIFLAAQGLHSGLPVSQLYTLVARSWDVNNRALSLGNLGQYMYMFWIYSCLYWPTIFDLHINIYLVYFCQIIVAFIIGLRMCDYLYDELKYDKNNQYYFSVFAFFILCPIIIQNAYKMLREIFWIYFYTDTIIKIKNRKRIKMIISGTIAILIRPLSLLLFIPPVFYHFFSRFYGFWINLIGTVGIYSLTPLLRQIGKKLNAPVTFKAAKLSGAIHLFSFPSPVNQLKLFTTIFSNPNWQLFLYTTEAIWNFIAIVMFLVSVIVIIRTTNMNYYIKYYWITYILFSVSVYALAYIPAEMTPRYKLVYIMPMMYFITVFFNNYHWINGQTSITRTSKIK